MSDGSCDCGFNTKGQVEVCRSCRAAEGEPFWCYWCAIEKDCSRCNGIAWQPDIPCEHPHNAERISARSVV